MNIGTPLTHTAIKVLLLGSGELGKEIAISLQRYGVEVIAVDRYYHAPAYQVAHRSHVINMTNAYSIRNLIAEENPHIIIPEIEAIATETLIELEAAGECRIVPNARAVQLTMNRQGIRELAAQGLALPTSKYAFANTLEELINAVEQGGMGYPCFVKPTMSSSGKGQSRVTNLEELTTAWETAQTAGRTHTGKVIVEANIEFDFEITLLTVRALNAQGEIETYFCDPIGHRQEHGDYRESWQPQPLSALALANAQAIAQKITSEIGGLGLFGVELFIRGDQVWFSEVSPRPHDTGLVTLLTQRQTEFDLHVRALLGLPVSVQRHAVGASAVILSQIEAKAVKYQGLEQALAIEGTEIRLFGKPEAFINRRMGVALAVAENIEQARSKATQAAELIENLS
jgi:phosphoribosylglycinamide formyltransferase 2